MDGWLDEDGTQAAEGRKMGDGGAADTGGTGGADDGFGLNGDVGGGADEPEVGSADPGQGAEFTLPGLGKVGRKAALPEFEVGAEAGTEPETESGAAMESGAAGFLDEAGNAGDAAELTPAKPFDIRQRRKALLERYFPFLAGMDLPKKNQWPGHWGKEQGEKAGSGGMPDGNVGIRGEDNAPGETGGYRYPTWDWYYRQLGLEPDEIDAEGAWDWAFLPLPKGGLPRERMFDWPMEHFDRHRERATRLMADPDFDPFAALDAALAEDEELGAADSQEWEEPEVPATMGGGVAGGEAGGIFVGSGDRVSGDASSEGGQPGGQIGDAGNEPVTGDAGDDTLAGGAGSDRVSEAGKTEAGQPQEPGQGADPAQTKAPEQGKTPEQAQTPAPAAPDKPVAPGEAKAPGGGKGKEAGDAKNGAAEPKWYLPVRNGKITSQVGDVRENPDGSTRLHKGTDYRNEEIIETNDEHGNPRPAEKVTHADKTVYALSDGKVISVTPGERSGDTVVIQLHNGDIVRYFHTDGTIKNIKKDDQVKGGQAIGVYNDSGHTTGKEKGKAQVVHVQIEPKNLGGKAVDAEQYLRKKQAEEPPHDILCGI